MKILNREFINETLQKIEKVINLLLIAHDVEMKYNLEERNELFCEFIKKANPELTNNQSFEDIQNKLQLKQDLNKSQFEWLSEQIYQFNRDLILLHYFYAILYSYNFDDTIKNKITESDIELFFNKANEIYKRYKTSHSNK